MASKENVIQKIKEDISLDICNRDNLKKYPELSWTVKKEAKLHLDYYNKLIDFKNNYIKNI